MLDRDDVILFCELLMVHDTIKTSELQKMVGIGYSKAVRILMDLQEMDLVERAKGPGNWKVKKDNVRKYLLLNTAN